MSSRDITPRQIYIRVDGDHPSSYHTPHFRVAEDMLDSLENTGEECSAMRVDVNESTPLLSGKASLSGSVS